MRLFNYILVITGSVGDSFIKATQTIMASLPNLRSRDTTADFYQQVQDSDKDKMAGDLRKVGLDMYTALDKYEAKHGY